MYWSRIHHSDFCLFVQSSHMIYGQIWLYRRDTEVPYGWNAAPKTCILKKTLKKKGIYRKLPFPYQKVAMREAFSHTRFLYYTMFESATQCD